MIPKATDRLGLESKVDWAKLKQMVAREYKKMVMKRMRALVLGKISHTTRTMTITEMVTRVVRMVMTNHPTQCNQLGKPIIFINSLTP